MLQILLQIYAMIHIIKKDYILILFALGWGPITLRLSRIACSSAMIFSAAVMDVGREDDREVLSEDEEAFVDILNPPPNLGASF